MFRTPECSRCGDSGSLPATLYSPPEPCPSCQDEQEWTQMIVKQDPDGTWRFELFEGYGPGPGDLVLMQDEYSSEADARSEAVLEARELGWEY